MTEASMNYEVFSREQWRKLGSTDTNVADSQLTPKVLDGLKAFNDQISLGEVNAIYVPLVDYIKMEYAQYERTRQARMNFLREEQTPSPFVIGIAGSVAVGKTTTAQLLQYLLQAEFGNDEVALVTTDGFLRSNADLKAQGLFDRKGFPESYDMPALLNFMDTIKDGVEEIKAPKYSHDISDVLEGEYDYIQRPKIFIIEGINTLQMSPESPIYLSDFFDLSIYLDAKTDLIEHWYLDRFVALLKQTAESQDPNNYFYPWTQIPFNEAVQQAEEVWRDVNLPNLNDYILPTRERADLVLHKTVGHVIDEIWLRKF
ncbi:type I pantothenate kinase [Weissella uvarum]|uniref:type I pantothenate kinase n=1 Tax=Weissella uvarum TaxID=1479233 RepID=UPI00196204E9|nr:type I pantothenate kinase [Weissella uvarum]MBM7617125.1 type I pantothenate kinase [Weissella uvarum]MCM0595421.1 type I pantothenate kinase [Weissella uvarum]